MNDKAETKAVEVTFDHPPYSYDHKAATGEGIVLSPHLYPGVIDEVARDGKFYYEDLYAVGGWKAIYRRVQAGFVMFDPKQLAPTDFFDMIALLENDYLREFINWLSTLDDTQLEVALHDLAKPMLASVKGMAEQYFSTLSQLLDEARRYQRDDISEEGFQSEVSTTHYILKHLSRIFVAIEREEHRRQELNLNQEVVDTSDYIEW